MALGPDVDFIAFDAWNGQDGHSAISLACRLHDPPGVRHTLPIRLDVLSLSFAGWSRLQQHSSLAQFVELAALLAFRVGGVAIVGDHGFAESCAQGTCIEAQRVACAVAWGVDRGRENPGPETLAALAGQPVGVLQACDSWEDMALPDRARVQHLVDALVALDRGYLVP